MSFKTNGVLCYGFYSRSVLEGKLFTWNRVVVSQNSAKMILLGMGAKRLLLLEDMSLSLCLCMDAVPTSW